MVQFWGAHDVGVGQLAAQDAHELAGANDAVVVCIEGRERVARALEPHLTMVLLQLAPVELRCEELRTRDLQHHHAASQYPRG